MNNRPFFSTTNVYDQNMFSAGIPFENPPTNNHFIQAQKQFVPGGVVFSFNPQTLPQPQGFVMQQMPYPNPNNTNGYYPSSLEQQIAASGLQKHGLESLNYQQQLASNPFQLKFHLNISTSCSDLMGGSPHVPASNEHQKDKEDKWSQISYRCKCNGNKCEANKKKKPKPKNSKNTRKKEEKEESSEFSSDSSKSSNDSSEDDQMSCDLNVRLNKGQKSKDMNDSQYWNSDECKFNKRANNEHNCQ